MGERYVVLGLAQARSSWFATVAQWANCGTIAAEFVKCVSAEELRARLASGRPFSAVLVDASSPALDVDLVDAARAAGCAVLVIEDRRGPRDRSIMGVAAVLPEFFDPSSLVEALGAHAVKISRSESLAALTGDDEPPAGGATVLAVCGPGGTGTSTVAMALAQGMAGARHRPAVVLADLALHAELAMLHDARDVVPGVQELVEAHRSRRPAAEEVRSFTFDIEERGYHLLLGLRRARAWAALRPRSFEAAFESLRRAFQVVVCDTDADLEGEEEGGSIDVEERHLMARTATSRADVVLAVGLPGMKGLHGLVRVLNELQSSGVDPTRVLPVVNRAPKGGRARSEITATVAALASASGRAFGPVLFLPERRLEEQLRDGVALPTALTALLVGAVRATGGGAAPEPPAPRPVQPGSLGRWSDDDEDDEAGLAGQAGGASAAG